MFDKFTMEREGELNFGALLSEVKRIPVAGLVALISVIIALVIFVVGQLIPGEGGSSKKAYEGNGLFETVYFFEEETPLYAYAAEDAPVAFEGRVNDGPFIVWNEDLELQMVHVVATSGESVRDSGWVPMSAVFSTQQGQKQRLFIQNGIFIPIFPLVITVLFVLGKFAFTQYKLATGLSSDDDPDGYIVPADSTPEEDLDGYAAPAVRWQRALEGHHQSLAILAEYVCLDPDKESNVEEIGFKKPALKEGFLNGNLAVWKQLLTMEWFVEKSEVVIAMAKSGEDAFYQEQED